MQFRSLACKINTPTPVSVEPGEPQLPKIRPRGQALMIYAPGNLPRLKGPER